MVGTACKLVMLEKVSRNWSQKIVSYFAMSLVMALTKCDKGTPMAYSFSNGIS